MNVKIFRFLRQLCLFACVGCFFGIPVVMGLYNVFVPFLFSGFEKNTIFLVFALLLLVHVARSYVWNMMKKKSVEDQNFELQSTILFIACWIVVVIFNPSWEWPTIKILAGLSSFFFVTGICFGYMCRQCSEE